jgi:hypothetical protein
VPGLEDFDKDLLYPDARAVSPTMEEMVKMREAYLKMKELEDEVKSLASSRRSSIIYPGVSLDTSGMEEAFKKMGESLVGVGKAASAAMAKLAEAAMLPHRGGWIESVGWVCERCGGESMDLDVLREVPCDGGPELE